MGKSTTPHYVIYEGDKPNNKILYADNKKPNMEKEIYLYIDSLKIGGNNEHISKALGYMPIPNKAILIDQRTKQVIEHWNAPAFMIF
jgi:hypothetical protein